MSDRMRVTGMYSGMDTESVIQQLVQAKSTKVTNLKNEQKKLEWKQTAWQDLNSKIYNLWGKTLTNLRLSSAYKKKTTTCSDTTKATVVASGTAVNGTQTLKVNSLAKSGYLTGAELGKKTVTEDGKTTQKNWETTDKLSEIGSGITGKTLTVTVGEGDDAKTTDIEITSDMTINGLVGKLKDAGLNASFDTANNRFFISSTATGKANDFTITESGSSNSALTALGLTEESGAKRIYGQDAEIELNGAKFTSDKNTFSINGLTISVTGVTTDEEISIVTADDYSGIYDTIKDFFTEYNELINEIDKLYNADSARKYDMLTDEQKESMTDDEIETWEDTIKGALLRKDSTLGTVMNTMINTMMGSFYTVPMLTDKEKESMTSAEIAAWEKENAGNKKHLSDFGIKTLNYFEAEDNQHHAYHIDGDPDDESTSAQTDKLKTAIAEDPEGVANFFANLCNSMYTTLKDLMGSTDYSSIYKVYNDKQLKTDYDNYTTKIKEAEEELSDYEDKWYDKFGSMETALSKLQSTQSTLSSMFGSN